MYYVDATLTLHACVVVIFTPFFPACIVHARKIFRQKIVVVTCDRISKKVKEALSSRKKENRCESGFERNNDIT